LSVCYVETLAKRVHSGNAPRRCSQRCSVHFAASLLILIERVTADKGKGGMFGEEAGRARRKSRNQVCKQQLESLVIACWQVRIAWGLKSLAGNRKTKKKERKKEEQKKNFAHQRTLGPSK
jgi:hypothetical protein